MPLGYAEDEDELMDDQSDPIGDRTPDRSISSRQPLDDVSVGRNPVMSTIASRKGIQLPGKDDYSQDPLMQQYEGQQQNLNQFRDSQAADSKDALKLSLLSQISSRASMGANTPTQDDFGKNLAAGVASQSAQNLKSREEDLDRRQKIVNAIEQRKAREAIADNTNQYRQISLGMRQDQINQGNQRSDNRLSSLNIGKANSLMNSGNLPKETTKLNAARNVQTLIDGIRNGEITDTKNVRAQLSNMIATIDFGTPGGVADRQAMGVDNLYSKLNDMKNKMTYDGKLSGTISPEYLSQLESEGHALGDRAAKNYAVGAQSILQGANLSGDDPDADPGQIHKLITQRAKSFLSQNGYDPITGEPMNRKNSGIKSGGMIPSANAGGKTPMSKKYSPSRNQTKIMYDDGTEETLDGKQ